MPASIAYHSRRRQGHFVLQEANSHHAPSRRCRSGQRSAVDRGGLASLFNRAVVHPVSAGLRWQDGTAAQVDPRGVISRPKQLLVQTARCSPGKTLVYRAPNLAGKAVWIRWAPGKERIIAGQGQFVEDLTADREITFRYFSTTGDTTPLGQFFCLDMAELALEIAETEVPLVAVDGPRISATFNRPQTGMVVFATANQQGWTCTADRRRVERTSVHGMLAVPVEGSSTVDCSFRQPGLRLGLGVTLMALLSIALLLVVNHRQQIRSPADD